MNQILIVIDEYYNNVTEPISRDTCRLKSSGQASAGNNEVDIASHAVRNYRPFPGADAALSMRMGPPAEAKVPAFCERTMNIIPCTRERFSFFVEHHPSLYIKRISNNGVDKYTVSTMDYAGIEYIVSCDHAISPLVFEDVVILSRFLRTCGVAEVAIPIEHETAETMLAPSPLRRVG